MIKVVEGESDTNFDAAKPPCEGFVRLTLDNIHLDGDLKVYPFATKFTFSKTKDGEPLTEFVADRNNNIRETKGEKVEGIEPDFLSQLLVVPLEVLTAFSNKNLRDILTSLWSVKKISPGHRAFNPTDTPSSEGFFAPEMEFDHGHLTKFVSKRQEGQPLTVFEFDSPVESNGFFYPSRIRFTLDPNGNASAEEFHLTVILSDLEVAAEGDPL